MPHLYSLQKIQRDTSSVVAVAEGEGRPHANIHTTLFRRKIGMHIVGGMDLTNKLLVSSQ